jgi:hypothetical protein
MISPTAVRADTIFCEGKLMKTLVRIAVMVGMGLISVAGFGQTAPVAAAPPAQATAGIENQLAAAQTKLMDWPHWDVTRRRMLRSRLRQQASSASCFTAIRLRMPGDAGPEQELSFRASRM